jgi:hypothetical protein
MRPTSFTLAALAAGLGVFTFTLVKQRRAWSPGASALALPPARPAGIRQPNRGPTAAAPVATMNAAPITWPNIVQLAASSGVRFVPLAATRALRLRRDRLGQAYRIDQGGDYQVFRETVSNAYDPSHRVVLVVGFRLRAIRDWPLPHWLFQRLCILTTPFWSGFRGFRVKLWMVDPVTKSYLGIYDWEEADRARTYLAALTRVLRPLSTPGSVFATLYPNQALEPFLDARAVATPRPEPAVNRGAPDGVPVRSA